jgi:hypothetical protein
MSLSLMNSPIIELFTIPTQDDSVEWQSVVTDQQCAYLKRSCVKVRKSQPEIAIGTSSVQQSLKQPQPIIICPHRFLERGQIFLDCLHLLRLHEPGNEIHRVSEVEIPGGSVDYFLVSVQGNRVVDFVGIELQALDTTGTLWPPRQRFLHAAGVTIHDDLDSRNPYGINWKMTAKTTLVQLHHKVETFENMGRHLVLALQDSLLAYMSREFRFGHIQTAKAGHSLHFHAYGLQQTTDNRFRIDLRSRLGTDAQGVASALGLQSNPNVEMEVILALLQTKISPKTLLQL